MKKLVILACARAESNTLKIFNELKKQKGWNQNDIDILDLYNVEVPYLDDSMLKKMSDEQEKLVNQFLKYEECIIVYPTWNWNIPGVLKSYFDLIMVVNKTFEINGLKMKGLTSLKQATIINTTGFKIAPKPIAYLFNINSDRFYVRNMLKILGAKKINIISLGNFGSKNYSDNDIKKFVGKSLHKL